MILIRNAEIYNPNYIGIKDMLLSESIIDIFSKGEIKESTIKELNMHVIDSSGKIVTPGFIDPHVHIDGGGGEGSLKTRTPEINISDLLSSGITTVIGCLGSDGFFRDGKSLLAKARALEEEGMSSFINTGSYTIPVNTITGSISGDIMIIDKVIGVGEIALSDHRGSQPNFDEFLKIVAQSKNAGMLSGKCGVTNVHMGDGKNPMELLFRICEESDISAVYMIPTHINRNDIVFEKAIEFAKMGGNIDITTSSDPKYVIKGERRASVALKDLIDKNVPIERIQFSSDAQGSLPRFDEVGKMIGLEIGKASTLHREFVDSVMVQKIDIESALSVITSNTANHYSLKNKGNLYKGMDSDIVIMNKESLEVDTVISKGKVALLNKEKLIKGIFE